MQVFGATPADAAIVTPDGYLGWLHVVWLLAIAAVATAFWSIFDRKRLDYRRLHAWLRLVVRIALALTLTRYGAQKIWPSQFPLVRPHQLLGQVGDYSPAQLLCVFIGTSRGYEMFTGAVELLAAALLFVPQVSTLGALVALAATMNVFMLNVFYDVTVKNFSLHLVLMALFLLIPDRIAFDRTNEPNPEAHEMYGSPWKADFIAEMRSPDLMLLHGSYNGHPAEVMMRREDMHFPLSSHQMHWIIRGPAHAESPYF